MSCIAGRILGGEYWGENIGGSPDNHGGLEVSPTKSGDQQVCNTEDYDFKLYSEMHSRICRELST